MFDEDATINQPQRSIFSSNQESKKRFDIWLSFHRHSCLLCGFINFVVCGSSRISGYRGAEMYKILVGTGLFCEHNLSPFPLIKCPINLYLIFEKSSWKNQVRRTEFLLPVYRDLPMEYHFSRYRFFSTIGIGIGRRF